MRDDRDETPEDGALLQDASLAELPPDLARHPAPQWLVDFRQQRGRGFYTSLGDHALTFADRGDSHLLVSFDNLSSARDDSMDRDPWGYGFAAKNGWSQLGVMAFRPSWFRDPELFDELRRLASDGFFRRFKSVTLTGTSMGAYAACAFASLVPGCTVIAFSPQSTLKKSLVPWEDRFSSGRKADWTGDFADAAVESAAAARVWLVYDPHFAPDVRHAQRFTHANVTRLPARYASHKTALFLRKAGILSTIVQQAVQHELTKTGFFQAYRRGRDLPWYIHGIAERLIARQDAGRLTRLISLLETAHPGPLARMIAGKALAAGLTAEKPRGPGQTGRALPVPDPQPVADLYMTSDRLPAPLTGTDGIWAGICQARMTGQSMPWHDAALRR